MFRPGAAPLIVPKALLGLVRLPGFVSGLFKLVWLKALKKI